VADRRVTRWLLAGGVIGPVVFVIAFLVEGWTRPGYDPMRMFVSLLALTDLGWQQVANFVVSGLLVTAGGHGLHRQLREGPGATWGPIFVYLAGVGMVLAGVFVTDPGYGYPPGTPLGEPVNSSASEVVHDLAALLAFAALAVAMLVTARRFAGEGSGSRWALYSRLSGLGEVVFLVGAFSLPDVAGLLQRIAILLALGWVAQVCWRYWREASAAA